MLLIAMMPSAWAIFGSRLIGMSQSGQTLLFDIGEQEGRLREGDFGVVIKEIKDPNARDLRLVPVGKVKNIKLYDTKSAWVLYKSLDKAPLVKGEKYLLLTEFAVLQGRRDPRLGKLTVVTEKEKADQTSQAALAEDKDRLAKLKDLYPEAEPLHWAETRTDTDVDLVEVEVWDKNGSSKHRSALYKSPYKEDFKRELRLETFEKLVAAYLKKVNDPGFNYDAFYDEQMRTEFANEFRRKPSVPSEYENFLSLQSQKAIADAKLYRAMLEKGESWSEDFSDEELRTVLREVSVLQERDRRKFIVANPNQYVVYLDYALALTDAQTDQDPGHRRGVRYAVDLDLEATPFLNHPTLERFTVNGTFRVNRTALEAENSNVDLDEYSLSAGVNWYPIYATHVVEAPSVFLGASVRSGWASASAPTTGDTGKYTVSGVPGVRAGMRYNFQNNFGLRILASMEILTLDQYETNKVNTILPNEQKLAEGMMSFGVLYSF